MVHPVDHLVDHLVVVHLVDHLVVLLVVHHLVVVHYVVRCCIKWGMQLLGFIVAHPSF